ncbi:UNVERIFIED_CONTAM: Retrovirus-related Pol polyprotein from type-2 retrotransposable element R2DM [Sesamum angustifolium]|uniref:Retrovirus-related Pol polyprotein from type-2 retrotransposable element R2DM n=1 Tax=Sesamum angustifolium TaxID=2727405 RepID=A0AAW2JQP3_9LAMI
MAKSFTPALHHVPRTTRRLVLKGDSQDVQVSMFRFDNYLALSPGFLASVHNIWQHPVIGTPMYSVTRKLKALKPVFRKLKEKGDLAMNVKLAAGFLEIAQKLLQADRHNSLLLQLENCCRLVYLKATQLEHVMLRQRAKLQWLKGGDQCSKVFFRRVATRRANKRLFQISDSDGLVQTDPNIISSVFVLFPRSVGWGSSREGHRPPLFTPLGSAYSYGGGSLCSLSDLLRWMMLKQLCLTLRRTKHLARWVFLRLLKQVNATVLTLIPKCRLPPRCALKVDLRKAYDTVEWDFLFATLRLFGFPAVFIRWIEECVTSAHYSVVVNGGVHGFFAGARGLRQGDPMSPYLFVLVMEVLQMILQQFIDQDDCQPLLQKIDSRIKGWEGVQLSFAGRVQLIKSVLVSLEVYWAMAFILPKGIIKEMIKRLRTFLWKGTSSSGYPKVAWEIVCRPVEEGGQGIKDIFALNRALMSKHLWAVIKQVRTYWVDWIFQVRLRDCTIWTAKDNKGAWGWRKMLSLRHTLLSHIHFRVGDGTSFSLWHDPWHTLGPLITQFPRGPQMTNTRTLDKLSVVMKDGQWNWPMITDIACLEITYMLPPISEGQDRISWKSNDGSFKLRQLMTFSPAGSQGCLVFTFGRSFQDPKEQLYPLACYHGEIVHIG